MSSRSRKVIILTMCTGDYNVYLQWLLKSIDKTIGTEIENLETIIITDREDDIREIAPKAKVVFYPNFPYYLIANRMNVLSWALEKCGACDEDIVLFTDVDAYFLQKPEGFYKNLFKGFRKDRILWAKSPWVDHLENNLENGNEPWVYDIRLENILARKAKISDKKYNPHNWIQHSLFISTVGYQRYIAKELLKVFNEEIGEGNEDFQMPRMYDQSLANFTIQEKKIGNHKMDWMIFNSYRSVPYDSEYWVFDWSIYQDFQEEQFQKRPYNTDSIFMIQKHNSGYKDKQRVPN